MGVITVSSTRVRVYITEHPVQFVERTSSKFTLTSELLIYSLQDWVSNAGLCTCCPQTPHPDLNCLEPQNALQGRTQCIQDAKLPLVKKNTAPCWGSSAEMHCVLSGYKVLGSMAKHHKCDGVGRRGGEEGGRERRRGKRSIDGGKPFIPVLRRQK